MVCHPSKAHLIPSMQALRKTFLLTFRIVVNSKSQIPAFNKHSKGIIAGGVVGGVLLIAFIAGVVTFSYLRRRRRNENSNKASRNRARDPVPIEKDDQTNWPVELCGTGVNEMSDMQIPHEADQENGLKGIRGNTHWLCELHGDPHSLRELQGDFHPASDGSARER